MEVDVGMFEIVTVDGKPRFALRDGLTTNDFAELLEMRSAEFNARLITIESVFAGVQVSAMQDNAAFEERVTNAVRKAQQSRRI